VRRAPAVPFARTASSNTNVNAASGHSLMDAVMHHGPWPGIMGSLLVSAGRMTDMQYQDRFLQCTQPGSGIRARYEHDIDQFEPGKRAYSEADQHNTLFITEAGPPIRYDVEGSRRLFITETVDYECRFIANQIENGLGNDVVLWSIWPDLRGPGADDASPTPSAGWAGFTARTALPIYGYHYRLMAEYATAKMRMLYPALPSDWRVWMFPGHLFMQRVLDDFDNDAIPGVTDILQLMDTQQGGAPDYIHPGPWLMYGLSAMAGAAFYQFAWSDIVDPWEVPAYTAANGVEHLAIPPETAAYMRNLADEINSTYYHVGMGGTVDAEPVWTLEVDGDLMPNWTLADPDTSDGTDPEEPGGAEYPADLLGLVTAVGITDLNFSPPLPEPVGGYRTLTAQYQSPVTGALYVAVRGKRASGGPLFATLGTTHQNWTADKLTAAGGNSGTWTANRENPNELLVDSGVAMTTADTTLEAWYADGAIHISVDGSTPVTGATPAYAAFTTLYLNLYEAGYDLRSLILMGRIPTTSERAGIREALAA